MIATRVAPTLGSADLAEMFRAAPTMRALWWGSRNADRHYDGVWRRETRELLTELAWLLPAAAGHLGAPVHRMALSMAAWDEPHPPRVWFDGHHIDTGWFRILDPWLVTITAGPAARSLLLVSPNDPAEPPRPAAGWTGPA